MMINAGGDEGPSPVDRHVGRRVAERRISLGYNQTDLGRALGVSFQQIQKYEKGANRISASKLWEAAGLLNVDVDYFFAGLSVQDRQDVSDDRPNPQTVTRHTVEISRLSPRLSLQRQKLLRDLMLAFVPARAVEDTD